MPDGEPGEERHPALPNKKRDWIPLNNPEQKIPVSLFLANCHLSFVTPR